MGEVSRDINGHLMERPAWTSPGIKRALSIVISIVLLTIRFMHLPYQLRAVQYRLRANILYHISYHIYITRAMYSYICLPEYTYNT